MPPVSLTASDFAFWFKRLPLLEGAAAPTPFFALAKALALAFVDTFSTT